MHKRPGERKFNVAINGKPVLTDFDIARAAGAGDKAVVREFDGILPNEDGNVVIRLSRGSAGEPVISGIEILPVNRRGPQNERARDAVRNPAWAGGPWLQAESRKAVRAMARL
jgi:hypothetical protein